MSAPASDDAARAASAAVVVPRTLCTAVGPQRGRELGQVTEHVQAGEREPDDEAHVVQRRQRAARARPGEQQRHAAREDNDR